MNIEELHTNISSCDKCVLCEVKNNDKRLMPNGFKNSLFALVGYSPETLSGKDDLIFKDNAKIKSMFEHIGLDLHTMWKTNIQKCSNNGDVKDITNANICKDEILSKEIEFVNPKVLFLIGVDACNIFDLNFDTDMNKFIEKDGFIYVPIVDPHDETLSFDEYKNQLNDIRLKLRTIRDSTFVNFHHHNQFSIRDGYGTEEQIVDRLQEIRSPGFSLTNHGNMNAHYRQYKESNSVGIKPIFGTEFYYNKNRPEIAALLKEVDNKENTGRKKELGKNTRHITVIAKNEQGYRDLIRINNTAVMESFYRFPIIDFDMLKKATGNIFVFSGCPASYISNYLLQDQDDLAMDEIKLFRENFEDDFYLELMSTAYSEQKRLNNKLIDIGKKTGIKTVITCDAHYVRPEDAFVHEVLLLSRNNATYEDLNDEDKKVWTFSEKDYYIKTIDNIMSEKDCMNHDDKDQVVLDSIANVNDIFSSIDPFVIDSDVKLPKVEDSLNKLIDLVKEGIKKRELELTDEIRDRIKMEIKTIVSTGYIDYFIILCDIIRYAKEKYGEYSIGPGRGSAAASLVNYLLDITDAYPMNNKLMMFERFLSPSRGDLPDIDLDLSPDIRDKVLDHLVEKYGEDRVISIGNYGTNKVKSSIADVFRTLAVDYSSVLKITKSLPNDREDDSLDEIRNDYPVLDKMLNEYPDAHNLIEKIRNQVRSIGSHAAGVIVSGVDIHDYLPIYRTSTGKFVTANTEGGDFHELSEMGFVKYDFLSLSCLRLISEANKEIKNSTGVDIDWKKIDYEDDDKYGILYELLDLGDTYGIFQYASSLATDYLKKMKPRKFFDFAAASGLLRPGPLDQKMHVEYYKRLNGDVNYTVHPSLESILGDTHGIIVYQEQIMRICTELAEFTGEESNVFRKALVKYEKSEKHERERRAKVASFADKLIEGLCKYMDRKDAEELWELIESFARYGFNFAHCYSYAILSFRQLYQKFYYPVEFYCAALNVEPIDDTPTIIRNILLHPARKMDEDGVIEEVFNIEVLKPNLVCKNFNFEISESGKAIRYGLGKLKQFTVDSFNTIIENLKDDDLQDFEKIIKSKYKKYSKRIDKMSESRIFGKKIFQALIYSGAFDYLFEDEAESGMEFQYRNKLIEKYNEITKSEVELIKDSKHSENLEIDYMGFSINKIKRMFEVKKEIESISEYSLLKAYDQTYESFSFKFIDYAEIVGKRSKTSKNGRKFTMFELMNSDGLFFPIFSWNAGLSSKIKVGDEIMAEFNKQKSFVNISKLMFLNGEDLEDK